MTKRRRSSYRKLTNLKVNFEMHRPAWHLRPKVANTRRCLDLTGPVRYPYARRGPPAMTRGQPNLTRLLLLGESTAGSSPLLTITEIGRAAGFHVQFQAGSRRPEMWLRQVQQSEAVIFVGYESGPDAAWRLQIAEALDVPVVRWWVGSDVLACLHDPEEASAARELSRHITINLTVAPHLRQELEEIGIRASVLAIPTHRPAAMAMPWSHDVARTTLAYLPTDGADFYGAQAVRQLALACPHLRFIVVADTNGDLADLPNVVSLPFVKDMEPIYRQAGSLLRLTRHDGLPRMVLEALGRGRYVIYSRSYPHCIYADSAEQAREALAWVSQQTVGNLDGFAEVSKYDVARDFLEPLLGILELCRGLPVRTRMAALTSLPKTAAKAMLASVLGRRKQSRPLRTSGAPSQSA
jgi:hypothetical protein